jgi:hypothetical protein
VGCPSYKLYRLFQSQHSFSVTIFTLGFRLFFILLQINLKFILFLHAHPEASTGETTGTGPVAGVPGPAIVGPPKNPCPGPSHNYPAPKTPVRARLTIAEPETGTGDRGPAGGRVLVFS